MGFGLSYTSFSIQKAHKLHENEDQIDLDVTVQNTGHVYGEHPIFVYLKTPIVGVALPEYQLIAFNRISLEPGMRQTLTLTIDKKHVSYYDTTKVAAARTAVVADAELRHVVKHTVVFCFDGDLQGDWLHLVAHAGTGKVAIICKSPGFP